MALPTIQRSLSLSLTLALVTQSQKYSTLATSMMKAVQYTAGGPDKLYLGELPQPTLKPGEALLRVHSSAVNRADTLQRRGLYPAPPGTCDILGLEAAGVIEKLHPELPSSCNWSVGDKAMALLPGGGNAEYVTVNVEHLMSVPSAVSMLEAGGIPEVWLTAYQILHTIGQLKSSDTVLIHAGASGVGTAAIQLVRLLGAIPIITAGSDEKIAYAKSVGAAAGYNYKVANWSEGVLNYTKGHGVDLILDCVGATHWESNNAVIALDGRWVLYGLMGGTQVQGNLATLLRKRVTISATSLRSRSDDYKAKLVAKFTSDALKAFDGIRLKPIVETTFDLADIIKAHTLVESNKTIGKVLLRVVTEKTEL